MRGFLPFVSCCAALWFAASPSVKASLPALDEQPWIGHFIGYEDRKFRFGLTMQGKGVIQPMKNRTTPVFEKVCPKVLISVEELVPGREPVVKRIQPETLETSDEATTEPESVSFRGKVTGDAAFEVSIENKRGDFAIGGRVTDPGKLKNPLRFTIQVDFSDIYPNSEKNKAFEKKIEKDRVSIKRFDGKRLKLDGSDKVDAKSEEVNGTGIESLEAEFSPFAGVSFEFGATGSSIIKLSNKGEAPLYEGFTIHWIPDAAKDTDGKARLHFTAK